MKQKKIPMRMCIGCRANKPKNEMARIVKETNGEVSIDYTGKKNGRGAYVCNNPDCLKKSIKSNAIARALQTSVNDDIINQLKEDYEFRQN